jgi:hypothetical protein
MLSAWLRSAVVCADPLSKHALYEWYLTLPDLANVTIFMSSTDTPEQSEEKRARLDEAVPIVSRRPLLVPFLVEHGYEILGHKKLTWYALKPTCKALREMIERTGLLSKFYNAMRFFHYINGPTTMFQCRGSFQEKDWEGLRFYSSWTYEVDHWVLWYQSRSSGHRQRIVAFCSDICQSGADVYSLPCGGKTFTC